MNYLYYIVDKNNMTILTAEPGFVEAYNRAQQMETACAIFQGCFLTETAGAAPQMPDNPEPAVINAEE